MEKDFNKNTETLSEQLITPPRKTKAGCRNRFSGLLFGFVSGEKKFSAFTLAETLITLAIIGVIAAITVPSLITSIKERQYATATKKAQSILGNGYRKLIALNDGEYNSLPIFECKKDYECLKKEHSKAFQIASSQSYSHNDLPEKYTNSNDETESKHSWDNVPFIFTTADGIIYGFVSEEDTKSLDVIVDVNGKNSPNRVKKDLYKYRTGSNGEITDVTEELEGEVKCKWTEWFDVDYPKYEEGGGDFETYEKIRGAGGAVCKSPKEIECEAENYPGLTPEQVGQRVHCDINLGLVCRNDDQLGLFKMCYNYRMRVLCCGK